MQRSLEASVATTIALLVAGCGYLPPLPAPPTPSPAPASQPASLPTGAPKAADKPSSYAERPITLLVGEIRGTKADFAARLLAPRLERALGQPVVVVNREGGEGVEAWTQLKQAKPDGYTVGLIASPQIQIAALDPALKAPFAVSDFLPLAVQAQEPKALLVRASSPFRTVEDLLTAAKAQSDAISVSVPSSRVADALPAADLQKTAHVKLRVVPFLNPGAAATAALGGQVDVAMADLPSLLPVADSGQARLLAVLDETRVGERPEVPTLRERGVDVVSYYTLGYAAPKGTSEEIAQFLAWTLYLSTTDPGFQSQARAAGMGTRFMDSQQYGKFLAAETERVRALMPYVR